MNNYPKTVWSVTPAFNIRPVVLVAGHEYRRNCAITDSGASVYLYEMHETREKAVQAARETLRSRRQRLVKTIANLEKHEATFKKVEAAA